MKLLKLGCGGRGVLKDNVVKIKKPPPPNENAAAGGEFNTELRSTVTEPRTCLKQPHLIYEQVALE